MKKSACLFISLLWLCSCGGGGSNGDNGDGGSGGSSGIPDVSGSYRCTSGCSGTCTFDSSLEVIQDEESFILRGASDFIGTVDGNGDFETSSDRCACSGHFISGTATAVCTCGTTDCQIVTYERE